jgi:hypothetical protein
MQKSVIERIHSLANKRHDLYVAAGHRHLTKEELDGIHVIDKQLQSLWEDRRYEMSKINDPSDRKRSVNTGRSPVRSMRGMIEAL